jgi:hypothetical protein
MKRARGGGFVASNGEYVAENVFVPLTSATPLSSTFVLSVYSKTAKPPSKKSESVGEAPLTPSTTHVNLSVSARVRR